MPQDRGAEQRNINGLEKYNLTLGIMAAETCGRVAAQQVSGSVPWISVGDPSKTQRLQAEQARMQRVSNGQLGGPEKLTGADDPPHALKQDWRPGGPAGKWRMVTTCVTRSQEFDDPNEKVGAE